MTSASYVTNANGQITVNIKATVGGIDAITAIAIGATKKFELTVDPNLFKINTPVAAKEVDIGTYEPITIEYTASGAPVVGDTVNFATTRGILSGSTAVTGADGKATVTISSTNSGPALLSAFVTGGPSAQVAIEFVAPTANKMSLQANPAVIGTNGTGMTAEKSLITAIVRDAKNNLVKNKTIMFTIVNDSSSGSLSPGSATTDSSGTANTYFIAGATPGAKDGVEIRATVVGAAVTATTKLTVAERALFITLQTGPDIGTVEPNKYKKDYVALVTDAAGNPVKDAVVTATVNPMHFRKGYYIWQDPTWVLVPTLIASSTTLPVIPACRNEDLMLNDQLYDLNGLLDVDPVSGAKEDQNANNRLDPGNVASVSATATDSNGFSTVSIVYARNYAAWVNVRLEVSASSTGDTARAFSSFDLPGAAKDYSDEKVIPPGYESPFGTTTTCFDTRPDAPTGLTAAAVSTTTVNLSWQAAANAAGYKIYRDGVFLKSVSALSSSDTGLSSGVPYCYAVSAYDETGNDSAQSAQVCVTTPSLAAPTNLSVTAASSAQINLSWTASAGAVSYKIYRNGTYLKSVATTAAADTGLNSSTQYCYAVSAVGAAGESAQTSQLCASTPALATPTNLSVTAATSDRITLSWTLVTGATGYKMYRDGIYLKSVRTPDDPLAVTVTVSDTGLLANTPYCYSVSAYDLGNNESAQSSQLCATTYGPPPTVPAEVTASAVSPTKVDLSWAASAGAAQYKIYRNGSLLVTPLITTASYSDTTVVANTQYIYTVTAIDSTGSESGESTQSSANTGLTVPSTVKATANSSTQTTVSWVNSGGALVTGYNVYKGGTLLGAASPATTTSIAEGGLTPSTQYCYSVSSTDSAGNESAKSSTVCATTQAAPVPTYIDLLVSNPQLNSDGLTPVTLTALVKDEGNRAIGGQNVTFAVDSGILNVVSSVTNGSGQATATLGTGGNQKNRQITVTAGVGSLTTTQTVEVAGTTVTITGQTNTVLYNSTTTLTVYLKDSGGNGIPYQTLTLTSLYGNTLTPATVTTNASGQAATVFTATDTNIPGRTDTVTATSTAMNATGSFDVAVQNDATAKTLTFTAPTSGKEVAINTDETVTVHYEDNTGPLGGKTVNFFSTRGTIASTAVTDNVVIGSGDATLTIRSKTPGPAVLTASVAGGPTATVPIEFVAIDITGGTINLQADPATIGINLSGSTTQRSNIVAVVRDAENNLIRNKTINFNITDPSGGSLSAGSAVTDSFGSASVQFIAGATSTAKDGVEIRATVAETAITANTKLTVAEKPLFITVGTGNEVRHIDPNYYQVDFGVLVTDAAGNPIKDADVTASLMPIVYMKGYYPVWIWDDATETKGHWQQTLTLTSSNHPLPPAPYTPYPWPVTPAFSCANEDLTFYNDPNKTFFLSNGILDTGEDFNGNESLDPGGVAAVTTSTKTDDNGVGPLTLTYGRDFANWVYVRVDVTVLVAGTEGAASMTLLLPGAKADYTNFDKDPPGKESPFGVSNTCADSL
ncbi:Ig-like domain-containing protein [Patescibacteria group bacterium]|nr:Ig-like domain-containing protein [Patescibacteria group bacterium]